MEVLAKTEYQDLYRVTDGVLLVVNKFVPIKIEGIKFLRVSWCDRSNSKTYNKGCQKELKILTKEYRHEGSWCEPEWSIPKGTVVYGREPVIATDNKADWGYEVKTTGSALSGDFETIENLLSDILYTIRTGGER
jgi:hypothetical protein